VPVYLHQRPAQSLRVWGRRGGGTRSLTSAGCGHVRPGHLNRIGSPRARPAAVWVRPLVVGRGMVPVGMPR
jgi:hypothetical protein